MTTTPNLGIDLPVVGGDTGTWATKINAGLLKIDAHDHSDGKGLRIKPAAMDIDDDLDFASNALTNLGKLAFAEVEAPASGSVTLYVDEDDSELYWLTSGGSAVKLTNGASINTTLVGGIVGDYTSVDAEVAYDDANSRYTFKSPGTPKTWAVLAGGEVRIYETGTSVSAYVGLKSPGSLAASYSLTWPDELPASTLAMQVDSSGNVTASNTFASALSAPDFKHSTARVKTIAAMEAVDPNGTHTKSLGGTSGALVGFTLAASTNVIAFPVSLDAGMQIASFTVRVNKTSDATNTISARLYSLRTSTLSSETAQGSGASNSANNPGYISISESSLSVNVASGFQYYVVVTPGGATGDTLYNCEVNYTRP